MREIIPLELSGQEINVPDRADWKAGTYSIFGPCGTYLFMITSHGFGWEHVSVSTKKRCPNWIEMSFIKDLFWAPEEVVMQLHPAKSDYINQHPHCLHLWKPTEQAIPLPPKWMVGKYLGWENDLPEELKVLA